MLLNEYDLRADAAASDAREGSHFEERWWRRFLTAFRRWVITFSSIYVEVEGECRLCHAHKSNIIEGDGTIWDGVCRDCFMEEQPI